MLKGETVFLSETPYNRIGQALIGRKPIFFKILYAFNVLSKLCKHFAVNNSCIFYLYHTIAKIVALKGATDFSIQFSSTVLYFNNLSIEEQRMFYLFYCHSLLC